MWIKKLPADYYNKRSGCYNEVFLWQSEKVFVMDNHKSALWCWMQACNTKKSYNFMHIDRHYDLQDFFSDEDLEPYKSKPQITFDEYSNLLRKNSEYKVHRWDTFIMAGYVLHPRWFHSNIFLTHQEGMRKPGWGHKALEIREENPLFMEWYLRQYIEEHDQFLEGFKGADYKLPWIVSLDLDVFYVGDEPIRLFSDEYISQIAGILQKNIKRIAALTIAVSPDCLGGDSQKEKWDNGFSVLKVMSEKLVCLREFISEVDLVRKGIAHVGLQEKSL